MSSVLSRPHLLPPLKLPYSDLDPRWHLRLRKVCYGIWKCLEGRRGLPLVVLPLGKHQCFACLLRQKPQKHGGWKTPSATDEPKCEVQEKVNFSCHMWPKHMCSKWPEWPKWRGWPKWPTFTCGQLQQNSWATLHGRDPNSWAVKVVTRQRWSPEADQDYLWHFCIGILHLNFVFCIYIWISKQRWSPEAVQDYLRHFCICARHLLISRCRRGSSGCFRINWWVLMPLVMMAQISFDFSKESWVWIKLN